MALGGFLTRSVRDTAVLLDATAGTDVGAPYWAPLLGGTLLQAIDRSPGRLRIALCKTTLSGLAVHSDCRAAVISVAKLLEELGHLVEVARPADTDIGSMERAWTDIVACGSALTVSRKLDASDLPQGRHEIEAVARGAIAHAAKVSGERYLESVNTIHSFGRTMANFMSDYDIFLSPTIAEPSASVGRFEHDTEDYIAYRTGSEGVFRYSPFTAAFNASGQPAVSVPLYWSDVGLPIGVHLAARFGEDERLISICAELERARPWFDHRPAFREKG
ncbi:MAG: amidase family protein [Rhodobacter sp.]|nr:amidase family protein [Rhodobacter sp.]